MDKKKLGKGIFGKHRHTHTHTHTHKSAAPDDTQPQGIKEFD